MSKKHLLVGLFALLAFVSVCSSQAKPNPPEEHQQSTLNGLANVSPQLVEVLKTLQPDDLVLVWIDIEAKVDRLGSQYLPTDLVLYGIKWIMITFDPNIEQNHLFWVLAETRAGKIQKISDTHWVKNITLVRTGKYERSSPNPKFKMEGIDYAIQRALIEGNKTLQFILYLRNQTRVPDRLDSPNNNKDIILANVTTLVSRLGGEVLRIGLSRNKFLARIPSHKIINIIENSYVSEIYLQGPVVFEGETLLDIHAESDITLQHIITQPLVKDGIFYKLSLRELDEFTSHIDQVKLYAVDTHGQQHPCILASAIHSQQGRITLLLRFNDETRVNLHPTETIDLKFTYFGDEIDYFIFEINGYNRKIP